MFTSEVITELSELESDREAWDALAVAAELPLMAPSCVAVWWRHLAPGNAALRLVAVRDTAGRLVGLAPFYLDRRSRVTGPCLRLPGIELGGRIAPLAAPDCRDAVAAAIGRGLVDSQGSMGLMLLEGMPMDARWPEALAGACDGPTRPVIRRYGRAGSPCVTLDAGSFEEWLGAKSSNFRSEMRRLRRRFGAAGGSVRWSTQDTIAQDVATFVRLHRLRWEGRGSSSFVRLGPSLAAVLEDLGRVLLTCEGRFRLILFEVNGEPISAQLFLAAGRRVLYINGGWDERFTKLKPSMLGLLAAVEEGIERRDGMLDLGPGEQAYKLRFADRDEPLGWTAVVPGGARLPAMLARTAPLRTEAWLRDQLKRRLSAGQLSQLRRGVTRVRGLRQ